MDILTLAQINNLKKRGGAGYIELGRVLYPEQTLTYENTFPFSRIRFQGNIYELVVGNEYWVYWNGKEYRIICTYENNEAFLRGFEGETQKFQISYDSDVDRTAILSHEVGTFTLRVETPTIVHPIDQKFIPTMDSITLNGADGKQYKVTVDASGALKVTAIE